MFPYYTPSIGAEPSPSVHLPQVIQDRLLLFILDAYSGRLIGILGHSPQITLSSG